jgi:hypothetical protein
VALLLSLLLPLLIGSAALLAGTRADILTKFVEWPFLLESLAVALTAIAALFAAVWLALPDANQQGWVRLMPFVPLPLWAVALVAQIPGTDYFAIPLQFLRFQEGYHCAIEILLLSVLPALGLLLFQRRALPIHHLWAGCMAGLFASGTAYLCLRLIEFTDDTPHVIAWHILPVVTISALGAGLGRLLTKKPVVGKIFSQM